MKKLQLLSTNAFIFFSFFTTLLSQPIQTNNREGSSFVGKYVHYLEDPESKLDFAAISSEEKKSSFLKSESDTINFGQTNYSYWLKMDFKNETDEKTRQILEIDYSNIDEVEFYQPLLKNSEIVYEVQKTGMKFPFSSRKWINRNFIYLIELLPGENKTIFFRTRTSGGLILPLVLWNDISFMLHDSNVQQGLGFYYGLMVVMLLYNLFIYLSVRDISYFYYIGYIFGLLGIQLVLTGHGFQYLWSDFPWMQRNFYVVFSGICLVSSLLFARSFLNIKEHSPLLNKIIGVLVFLNILVFFSVYFLPPESTVKIALIVTVPSAIIPFFAGIVSFMKNYKPARYYLLAFSALILSGLLAVSKFLNVLGSNFFTDYGLYIGSGMEVVLLSLALASRINIIKKEKEEAQAKTLEMQKILTESYARFVPRDFLANLGKESILDVRLGDQIQKDMAVLFSDIRSFTTLSEKMSPAENFNFINSYLGRMSPIIQKHNGFIDKFIGDAIMALFDKQVLDAVAAGVEMQLYLKEYNAFRARRTYDPIQIGIGIHSGSLMLGTIGAEERLEGTVISDTVNLASRIENLTKVYGARIAVSESAIVEIKNNQFSFRFLDRVKVKGKQKPVSIYEILDGDEEQQRDLKNKTKSDYESGVKSFHTREFSESKSYFDKVIKENPNDKSTQLYLKRLYTVANPVTINKDSDSIFPPDETTHPNE
ncbi:7TM diverse intracellular signaling domain-containing protein [Leptospira kobayashii]|uniref:7TM diverse intracellular signaling domain-containing protein n=1 Tax=Leptospira kobayashii TaxID=1917830 RepID=UPI000D58EDF0|nr:7TM diverse intracellular signaling domain-containing protein [Leptospira kobayashii]